MLQIIIPKTKLWDEETETFNYVKETTLSLEHSLVSISKWESKFHKPFFKDEKKTEEELLYYIKCMTLTQNVNPMAYLCIPRSEVTKIKEYMNDPMTAVYFSDIEEKGRHKETVTKELIYYWMFSFGIPKECEKWHINRLIALIRVFSMKNQSPKKRNSVSAIKNRNKLNAERKRRMNSRG